MRAVFRLSGRLAPWCLALLLGLALYPSRNSSWEMDQRISQLSAEVNRLRQEQAMPTTVLKQHRNSICYIYVVYSLEPPASQPYHRQQHTRVSGTGFVVADGLLATNRHVIQPWYEDPDDEALLRTGAQPRIEKLVAFFPGRPNAVALSDVRVSPESDLAVARFNAKLAGNPSPVPLAATAATPGDPVVVIGYPLGVSAMLAKSPLNVYKRLASTKDTIAVATELAANSLIRPSATYGHVGDIVSEKIIYDAPTAQGGSGGPVFNSNGEVIAINSAYIDGFTGGTIGITAAELRPLVNATLVH